jgi:hypothetical protein
MSEDSLTLRQYATQEKISLGTAYRRIWEGKVSAKQILGRWLIEPAQQCETEELQPVQS